MIAYYNKEEFAKVVIDKIATNLFEQKANVNEELSTIYFENSSDIEYGIRGKAFLKTSYNNNGYFIIKPKE